MAHVSVVKRLERCERMGHAKQGSDAATTLLADTHQFIKYKVRIKDFNGALNSPPACKLLHLIQSKTSSSPSPPCTTKLQLINLQSLHDHEVHNFPSPPLKLLHCTLQETSDHEDSCTSSPAWKLQLSEIDQDGVAPSSAPIQLRKLCMREENPSSPWDLQTATKEAAQQEQGNEENGKGGAESPWKLQNEVQENRPAGRGFWDAVKKMECECCSMEEECTEGYEERVRGRLRGHWLCGLCEEAVGEEKKRVGGNVQAALVAHMQPCKGFSGRARSRVSPPSADVAVPRAVCRLLSRHLSTPSPHRPISDPTPLCRSSSCISSS